MGKVSLALDRKLNVTVCLDCKSVHIVHFLQSSSWTRHGTIDGIMGQPNASKHRRSTYLDT